MMTVVINGTTGISPVTASGTSASVDGMTVGRGGGEVSTNTAMGTSTLNANTSGATNTAIGYQALLANTTGGDNVAVGKGTLVTHTGGSRNTAVGAAALNLNTVSDNTAVGFNALNGNTSGGSNVAVGSGALSVNTTASNNTAVGYQAGYSTTTGVQNAALGNVALYANTTGDNNTATGHQSLDANTTGSNNTAVGVNALGAQTTASSNTAIGVGAGGVITTGTKNTILGRYDGNQGGLDIRTLSNRIVLSDGDGNPRLYYDNNGAIQSTSAVGNNTLYPAFFCRVWVQFNGTGTISITGSGNVSSLTDYSTGDYFVNFTTNMPDTTYCAVGASIKGPGGPSAVNSGVVSMSENINTYSCGISVISASSGAVDRAAVFVAVFR
jgi:hypothetical protein